MEDFLDNKFKTILIGITFSPSLKNNVYEAMRMVDFFFSKLIIVHVGQKTEQKENTIKELLSGFSEDDDDKVQLFWKNGDPSKIIVNTALENNADLIILGGTPRKKGGKFFVGSIARKITRGAHCSVLLLVKPSEDLRPCNHIVVNGLEDEKTKQTIFSSFEIAQNLGAQQLTIVEEISQQKVQIVVDDKTLEKANKKKEELKEKEHSRVLKILDEIPEDFKMGINIKTQPIFGKKGYSIGHYAKVVTADLLVMNAPGKINLWGRIFTRDLAHILLELPTDVLIIR